MNNDHVSSDVQTVAIMAAILYAARSNQQTPHVFSAREAVHVAHTLFSEAVAYSKEKTPDAKEASA